MENLLFENKILSYELKNDTIDNFAIEMIHENSNLNCLISMNYNTKNNNILFDTQNYITLSSLLESSLDIKLVLSIFTQICEIVNYAKIHMLYENNLILELENIFFDENNSSIKMIYIPINESEKKNNFRNFFKELMLDLETDNLQISSSIFKKINKKPFDLNQFLDFLKFTEKELFNKDITKNQSTDINTISIEPIKVKNDIIDNNEKDVFETATSKIEKETPIQPIIDEGIMENFIQSILIKDNNIDKDNQASSDNPIQHTYENETSFDNTPIENVPISVDTEDDEDMIDIQHFLETNQDDDNSYNTMMAQLFTPNINDIPTNKNALAKIIRLKDNSTMVINKKYFIIGASSHTDFTITDNPQISRSHATIIDENGQYYISDNGSSNGTCVNGKRVKQLDKVELKHKDVITLANDEKIMFYID